MHLFMPHFLNLFLLPKIPERWVDTSRFLNLLLLLKIPKRWIDTTRQKALKIKSTRQYEKANTQIKRDHATKIKKK